MWRLYECSAQGRNHIKDSIPCQDKTYVVERNGTYTIALADGAGSASMSHYGAEIVTEVIANELCDNFESYWDESDVSVARFRICTIFTEALQIKARSLQCEVKDLASTLLVVATKDNRFIAIHLGDGVIGYLKNDELKVASAPNNGEFCNTTVFTTSAGAEGLIKMIKAQSADINGFILMSDGPEACLYKKSDNTLASGLLEMLKDAAVSEESVVNANIRETMQETIVMNTYDDCSITMMVKCPENVEVVEELPKENISPAMDAADSTLESSKEKKTLLTPRNYLIFASVVLLLIILCLL